MIWKPTLKQIAQIKAHATSRFGKCRVKANSRTNLSVNGSEDFNYFLVGGDNLDGTGLCTKYTLDDFKNSKIDADSNDRVCVEFSVYEYNEKDKFDEYDEGLGELLDHFLVYLKFDGRKFVIEEFTRA